MPAILATVLAWIVESTLARFIWSTIAWWFMTGLIPVVVSSVNSVAGDPLSLIPDGAWWLLDVIGFDVWINSPSEHRLTITYNSTG